MSKLKRYSVVNAASIKHTPVFGKWIEFDDVERQLLALRGLAYQSMTSKTMAKKNAKAIHEAISIMLGLE